MNADFLRRNCQNSETPFSRELKRLSEKQNRFMKLSEVCEVFKETKKARYFLTLSNKYFNKKMELMDRRFGF